MRIHKSRLLQVAFTISGRISRAFIGAFLLTVTIFVSLFSTSVHAAPAAQPVPLTLSVDWEGRSLSQDNLAAMRRFRQRYPHVKLVHFLNAAYFTKPDADATQVANDIRSVLRSGDELGLHIHGWKFLFDAAGVAFRTGPSFWEKPAQAVEGQDHGHDVIISAYTVEELQKVIRYSVTTLERNGFHGIRSFRAGGWMGAPNVLEALVREGFTSDSSAVPAELLKPGLGQSTVYTHIEDIWSTTTKNSRPYLIQTPSGPITEFPDNAGLADYVVASQVIAIFKEQIKNGEAPYLHYGFHQETAAKYIGHVARTVDLLEGPIWKKTRVQSLTLDSSIYDVSASPTSKPPYARAPTRPARICADLFR